MAKFDDSHNFLCNADLHDCQAFDECVMMAASGKNP